MTRTILMRCLCSHLVFAVFLGLAPAVCSAEEGAEETLNEILDTWRSKQADVTALKVSWEEARKSKADVEDMRASAVSQAVTLFLGADNEIRLVREPDGENSEGLASRDVTNISAFNGKRNFNLTTADTDSKSGEWPIGVVWDARFSDELHSMQIRPWLYRFRAFSKPVPGLTQGELRVVARDVVLKHHHCAVVEQRSPGDPVVGIYFVDLERDCSVLRYHEKVNDRVTAELNIEYEEHQGLGWIPSEWDAVFTNGTYSVHGVLTQIEKNPVLSSSDFEVDFPRGTIVFDKDKGQRSLMLDDGLERVITLEESAAGFRYEDIFSTRSGELANGLGKKTGLQVLIIVVICSLAGWFVVRRLRAVS